MNDIRHAATDAMVVSRRNLLRIRRVPAVAIAAIVQPIAMILMFGYVFGGSVNTPGVPYREFLVGGLFAVILTFGSTATGIAVAQDMTTGVVKRFRVLPMSRSAVLVGRVLSDLVLAALSLIAIALTGLAVGWRIDNGALNALAACGLLLAYAFALSWVMAYIGLIVPSVDVVNSASLMVIFPITFIANTLVPAGNLPSALRNFANWNPVSTVAHATRTLFGNLQAGAASPTAWPMRHAELYTLAWIIAIIAVFAPLAIRRYRTTESLT